MKEKDRILVTYGSERDFLYFYNNLPLHLRREMKIYQKWQTICMSKEDFEQLKNRMTQKNKDQSKLLKIESNIKYKLHDSLSSEQTVPWGVKAIKAPEVWKLTEGENVNVGIIDTGINGRHPDLWRNVKGGTNTMDSTSPFADPNGHGTHVAGTIAAVNNQRGVVGVAPKANVYSLKAFKADGTASLSDIAEAIDWAIDHNIHVLNMSFGSKQTSQVLHKAIKAAKSKGIIMVASSGNSGSTLDYPARHQEVLAIGAINNKGKIASFSNYGRTLNYVEPGVAVLSTWPVSPEYNTLSGTSMAAPHLSGVCALLLSKAPHLTPLQIKQILDRAAIKLPKISSVKQGRGVIYATKALQELERALKS